MPTFGNIKTVPVILIIIKYFISHGKSQAKFSRSVGNGKHFCGLCGRRCAFYAYGYRIGFGIFLTAGEQTDSQQTETGSKQ